MRIALRPFEECAGVVAHPLDYLDELEQFHALAGTQKMQRGLHPDCEALWRAIAVAFPRADGLGAWGDTSHQARKSCHNPSDGKGPRALDVMTTDPAEHRAIVAWAIVHRALFKITVIISRGFKWVWNQARGVFIKTVYLGRSKHLDHVHISNGGCLG
jgi:hypothetical protein